MRRAAVSVLAGVLLACGCSKEPPPAPPAPPPAPPVTAAPPAPQNPAPPLPALGAVNFREWTEVDEESFPALPAPATPPPLRWDFAPGRRPAYEFAETLTQRMEREAGAKRALNRSREKNRGLFEFVAGRDHTALAVAKIQTQEASLNDQEIPRESFAKKAPSVCQCVVSEDGAAEAKEAKGQADPRMYFQSLFALQPGTRDLRPGKITTRFAGMYKVERFECARLESEFEISVDRTDERILLRGRVVGYFALAEGRFIRASATVATSSRGNAKSKEGVWISSSLDAVSSFRVRLIGSR